VTDSHPVALLATFDLAERLQLLPRIQSWLDALRGVAGASLRLDGHAPRPIAEITPGEVLDAATAATPAGGPEQFAWDAFVIHAGADRAAARRVWVAMKLAGLNPYLDRANLRPGADWPRRLQAAMNNTRVFVVLVSENWSTGWYNQAELASAVSLCRGDGARRLIPVVLGARPMPPHELPYDVSHIQPVHLGALPVAEGDAAVIAAVRGE
jgi:hypothetical protein